MSSSETSSQVGIFKDKPNYDTERDPLDWETLKLMDPEDRKALVLQRANYLTMVHPLPFLYSRTFLRALHDEKNSSTMERPDEAKNMPVE